jgi:hypothetical protein
VAGLNVRDEAEQNMTACLMPKPHGWCNFRWMTLSLLWHAGEHHAPADTEKGREGGKMGWWTAEKKNSSTDMWNQDTNFIFSLN